MSESSGGRVLWLVVAVLLGATVLVAVYKIRDSLQPEVAGTGRVEATCDLHSGPCTARFGHGGSLEFSIEPRPVPLVTPLHLRVRIQGLDATSVAVDFSGLNMDMGYNRRALQARGNGVFEGQSVLPVCTLQRMRWEARVLVTTPSGVYAAPFRFETRRVEAP